MVEGSLKGNKTGESRNHDKPQETRYGGEVARRRTEERELEVERDELNDVFYNTNTESRHEPERPQQQRQVLKGSRRALIQSVSHITIGLKDAPKKFRKNEITMCVAIIPDRCVELPVRERTEKQCRSFCRGDEIGWCLN
jgi:hypothetical protein